MTAKPRLPVVTILFAVANVAVFAWELGAGADATHPTAQWMADHGGNFGPLTFHGEQWRLLTSMFLHYGLLHIAMNMVGLVDGGRHVERMYGAAGFVALYFVSGLAGSLASGLRGAVVSAGASGAIFGVFGAFGAFLVVHRKRLDAERVKRQGRGLLIFLAYNVYFGVTSKGIDLVAHGAGLATGFLVGLALEVGKSEDGSRIWRSIGVGVGGIAIVFGLAFVLPAPVAPRTPGSDFAAVEHVVLQQWNAMVPEMNSGKLTDLQAADKIDHDILPAWHAARVTFERDDDTPAHASLVDYMTAREDGWTLMAKALRGGDAGGFAAGMARFTEGDAAIKQLEH